QTDSSFAAHGSAARLTKKPGRTGNTDAMRIADAQFSPSALNNFLECEHLTALELEVARGVREQPHVDNPQADLIRRKGEEHEAAYLAKLRDSGKNVVEIDSWS